nr:unnamed protein product [Callosobruchus analis]
MSHLINKIRSLIPKFKYLKKFRNPEHLVIVYYALIQSLISYDIVAWGSEMTAALKKLEIIQKWVIRVIFSKNILYSSEKL